MTEHETPVEGINAYRPNVEEALRPLVTCGICLELYVDPVALLNCLHLACGSCAKGWLERSSKCHECREKVSGTRDSHHTAAIVEVYQSIAPDSSLCNGRPPEEIDSMREKYRPGQYIAICSDNDNDKNDDSEWEPYVPPDSPITISSRPLPPESPEILAPEPPSANDNQPRDAIDSCPFCDPSNETGFVCPQPCGGESIGVGRNTIPLGHTVCATCSRLLPLREDLVGSKCVVCTQTTCSQMGQTCRAGLDQRFGLSPLKNADFELSRIRCAFGDNDYERHIFESYATRPEFSTRDIIRALLNFHGSSLRRANWHSRAHDSPNPDIVNLDDMVCEQCVSGLVDANLFEWWMSKRSEANLPTKVTARPDCQYGIECRTAGHDSSHAETYNHVCRATEPVQELERDPENWRDSPEYGVRYVTQSSQSNVASLQFSPSSVIWMDGDGPVLLSSSVISASNGRAKIPGKTTLQRSGGATVHYGLNGQGYTHDGTVEVLMDTRNMHWVRTFY